MTSDQSLPRWDMSSIYPSLNSAEFEEGLGSAIGSIGELAELFDRQGIERREPARLDKATVQVFETVIEHYTMPWRSRRTRRELTSIS